MIEDEMTESWRLDIIRRKKLPDRYDPESIPTYRKEYLYQMQQIDWVIDHRPVVH